RRGQRPQRRTQPAGGPARARCAADRRALPLQLAEGRRRPEGRVTTRSHLPPLPRTRERVGVRVTHEPIQGAPMSLESLKQQLPEYAKDLKLNLSSLASETLLSEQQKAGAFVSSALAARNPAVTEPLIAEFAPRLSPEALTAAKAAASIMAMNNIYYRFTHLASAPDYRTMPARLRMNVIAKPGVDKVDFELWSLAVSAINGC